MNDEAFTLYIAPPKKRHGRFKKGDTPWNKGMTWKEQGINEEERKRRIEILQANSHKNGYSHKPTHSKPVIQMDEYGNRADNLEWCTVEYNNRYGTRTEKIRKSSGKRVAQYDLQGNLIKIWNSISEAMRSFGCNGNSGISRVCRGVVGRKTYKGFVWKYVDESILNKKQVLDYLETSLSKDELLEVINHLQKIYDKK